MSTHPGICTISLATKLASLTHASSCVAAPAYDLRRMTEGPALYLNGPPDAGKKMSLSTEVQHFKSGKFGVSRDLTMGKPACRKSMVGPDPYNINVSNPWHQRSSHLAFRVDAGEERVHRPPRPACARSLNLDPYLISTRENAWATSSSSSSPARASTSHGSHGSSRVLVTPARHTAHYFSPFPESLSVGGRAHTPRTSPTSVMGFMTQPTLTGVKAWDAAAFEPLGSPGSPGATSLPPLLAACRLPIA